MSGNHHHAPSSGRVLYLALLLTFGFAIIEFGAGWLASSLALMGDAGHMLTDSAALLIALVASWLSKKPPTEKHSYGLVRAEVVAALVNGLFMLVIVVSLIYFSIQRLQEPVAVDGRTVIIVGIIGFAINVFVEFILSRGEENINTKAALLHVMADLLGSVAAIASGVVIYYTDWLIVDPILTLLICVLILYSTFFLLKEVLDIIMEAVPPHIAISEIERKMAEVDKVASVHDLRVWTLSSGQIALSAHVVIDNMNDWTKIVADSHLLLSHSFHIDHITLQPETLEAGNVRCAINKHHHH